MAKETTVWIKPLDLPWEQVGTGQFQGITPENVNLEADTWGPSNATFDLRREPDAPALDLSAGAEVEVHVAGVNVWDGFVSSTPKKRGDLVTSVVCRGWQDELDGRIFTAGYVHTTLSDWKDMRSHIDANLAAWTQPWSVQAGSGSIVLGIANDAKAVQYEGCAALLDTVSGAKRIAADWTNVGCASSTYLFGVAAGDVPGTRLQYNEVDPASAASGTLELNTTASYRYWWVYFFRYPAATTTETADRSVKVTGARVFADSAYQSGGASVLKASTVVSDALDRGTLALSSDRSGIDSTSFNIPDLWPDPKGITARELISKVNAYHNWTAKLQPGRRFIFTARSTVPKVKVGEWSALPDDEDASSNDITDIYNHCRATSTEAGGQLVIVDRYSRDQPSARPYGVSSPAPDNPSMATNTANWSTTAGVLTRDTTTYDTAPASLRLDGNGAGADLVTANWLVSTTLTGPFLAGQTYAITLRWRASFGFNVTPECTVFTVGSGTDTARQGFTLIPPTFTGQTIYWTPTADRATATFTVTDGSGSLVRWFDTMTVAVIAPTILDRRRRIRSQILDATAALPADGVALTQLADTWLAAHMTTPFKGEQSIQGSASVRDYLNGDATAPERLLAMTTDLLHFDDRNNPDTGDVGRDGRLVKVSYQPSTDTVKTSVDNTRTDFNALLARIGVLAQ